MTSVHTTSPQWDNRNRGFIPPAQFQQLKQNSRSDLHEFPQRQAQEQPSSSMVKDLPLQNSPQPRPPNPSSNSHTRTSSFFSFRKVPTMNSEPRTSPGAQNDFGVKQPQPANPRPSSAVFPDSGRRASQSGPGPAPLHPEIRSIVQLTLAHAHKIYFSGPLVRRIERQPDGQHPTKDDGWTDVWAQLGGTTLSIWDMKLIEEANKAGKEVPPAYVNVTDAFVQVLGSVTVPGTHNLPPKRYTNVLTLNTAGTNLLLFSCPSTEALISWAAALRLSAWEKSRLEEIYTAHLLRISLPDIARDVRSPLVRGRMEGWVRIRVAGQTDWKKMWMVIASGAPGDGSHSEPNGNRPMSPSHRKSRMSMTNFFSRDPSHDSTAPTKPLLSIYTSPKPKDRKKAFLTLRDVTQAFAVYPEKPELISRSTLMKLEGLLGDEEGTGGMKGREGWLLVMPELEGGNTQAAEMLKWVIAFHDVFELYGRPQMYTWDPRDIVSMMFAYPVGPHKENLFLDRELAETLDPRDDRTSAVRSRLSSIALDRVNGVETPAQQRVISPGGAPTLPPLSGQPQEAPASGAPSLLPPLNFDSNIAKSPQPKQVLTPITENSSGPPGSRSMSEELTNGTDKRKPSGSAEPSKAVIEDQASQDGSPVLGGLVTTSPTPASPGREPRSSRRSEDSFAATGSRPDSKLSLFNRTMSKTSTDSSPRLPHTSPKLPIAPVSAKRESQYESPPSTGARPASPFSVLTSPHSPITDSPRRTITESLGFGNSLEQLPLTSPHSPAPSRLSFSISTAPSAKTASKPSAAESTDEPQESYDESALYYMQHFDDDGNFNKPPRRIPTRISENESSTDESSSPVSLRPPKSPTRVLPASPPRTLGVRSGPPQPVRRGTPMAFNDSGSSPDRKAASPPIGSRGDELGRKPSGARVQPGNNRRKTSAGPDQPPSRSPRSRETDTDESMSDPQPSSSSPPAQHKSASSISADDSNADALAALSFLNTDPSPTVTKPVSPPVKEPPPQIVEPERSSSPQGSAENVYRSSFAPSKQAAERKARSQAQQAANHAAAHKPGRSKSKRKSRLAGGWHESSDEEEEEEEEEEDDDDDVDSDVEPSIRPNSIASHNPPSSNMAPVRPLQPHGRALSPSAGATGPNLEINAPQPRAPRHLPQIPPARPSGEEEYPLPPRRLVSDQFSEGNRRTFLEENPQVRSQSDFPQPGAARQNLWSQVLDPGRAPAELAPTNGRETFIQLEPLAQTMTKAFQPQGLLSAGLQDKHDRSAKRQEELARESGASLINVPHKPPPPQTGLLGAITAHERERKRDGGVGAALTEREREKRMAEERQRKLDEFQRQQLDQMAQGGSMYGAQQFPGFNPMMGNPMMMGMNPMMTGMNPMMTGMNPTMTGLNPMMTGMGGYMNPGYANPHHMFAAQQAAAQAYQQAMMAFSIAGSQAGGDGGAGTPGGMPSLNPMMTGGSMGGYDPRFSMMGMPMMGSPMGMGGMGGMQMGSGFDPRLSTAMDNNLRPPGELNGSGGTGPSPNGTNSRNSPAPDPPRTAGNSPRPT